MAVTQYIGARYVPLFADPAEWSANNQYEPLTIVTYQGASYTSKQAVPAGIDITNADYWALTGNYNAQVEQYRQEVRQFDGRITAAQETADDAATAAQTVSANLATEVTNRTAADNAIRAEFAQDLADEVADINATITADVARLDTQDEALGDRITEEAQVRAAAINALDAAKANESGIASSNTMFLGCMHVTKGETGLGAMHCGDVAYADTPNDGIFQAVISSPIDINTQDMGTVHFISLSGNNRALKQSKNVKVGHAQGITYIRKLNKFYLAPLYTYANGAAEYTKALYIYDVNFSNMQTVYFDIPNGFQGIAYDRAANKLYGYVRANSAAGYEVEQGHIYEIDHTTNTIVKDIPITTPPNITWNQGFAVNNGTWYITDTRGNICSGSIATGAYDTMSVISTHSVNDNVMVAGEFNGIDFSSYNRLYGCADIRSQPGTSSDTNMIFTFFQILNANTRAAMVYNTDFIGLANYSVTVDPDSTLLRQHRTMQHPEIATIYESIFGGNINFNVAKPFGSIDENIYIPHFSDVRFSTVEGGVINARYLRFDAPTISFGGAGTLNAKYLDNFSRNNSITFISQIKFGSNVDLTNMLVNKTTGTFINCGGFTDTVKPTVLGTQLEPSNVYAIVGQVLKAL